MKSERAQALALLLKLLDKQQPLSLHLQDPNLSGFTKTLCFGFARHYYRLAAIADSMLAKRPKELNIWISILLGLLQIAILKLPDYAVVQETVALLPAKQAWAKGLVNAILRRFCREQVLIDTALSINTEYTTMHPHWLIKKLKSAWPNDWAAIIDANNTHPPMSVRVNLTRQSREAYSARLKAAQLDYQEIPYTNSGLIINPACAVSDLPGFAEGDVSIQDGAAQLAGPLLELQPGLRVLDACCAPGGKLNHILELEPNLAQCVGLDVEAHRLARVQSNCNRLGLQATLYTGDALKPETWWDKQPFDRILVDAPCSATGIIRRQPDIKLLRTLEDIKHISLVQSDILEALWPLLSVNGLLVYATCSIMPEENTEIIAQFLSQHPEAYLDKTEQAWSHATGHGWQILPGQHSMDGFFYAKIRKLPNKSEPRA